MEATSFKDKFQIVLPGDLVTDSEGFISGHGTFMDAGKIYASQAGILH